MTMLIVGLDGVPSSDSEMTKLDKALDSAIRACVESKSVTTFLPVLGLLR